MNNIYSDFPALMSDGRAYSNWQPASVINSNIRAREGITTNWDYRAYLQKNSDSIIAFDNTISFQETGCPYTYTRTPTIQHQSDLGNAYLSKIQLQEKIYPFLTQAYNLK